MHRRLASLAFPTFFWSLVATQGYGSSPSCSQTPAYPAPSLAAGFNAQLVATNLTKPRGIMFDTAGRLLVVQSGYGLTSLQLSDGDGGCVSVNTRHDIILDSSVGMPSSTTACNKKRHKSQRT